MKKKTQMQEAYSLIIEDIISGSLKPGSVVTEIFLSEKYGISRTPVREALYVLECEGLIITTGRTKRIFSLSSEDIREIFALKELIEGDVAFNAAVNINAELSAEMKQIIKEMADMREESAKNETESAVFLNRWLDLDKRFHILLFKASGNMRAQQVVSTLNIQYHRLKVGLSAMEGRIAIAIPEHEAIGNAIINKDASAARKEMVDHLENLKRYIIKLMDIFS